MNPLIQYFKDTRAELRHVAWPTQTQTVVYTGLVVAISVLTSLYLGLFDFLFTSGLSQVVNTLPASAPIQVQQEPVSSSTPVVPVSSTTLPLTPTR